MSPAAAAGSVTVIPAARLRVKIVPDSAAVTVLVESVILVIAGLTLGLMRIFEDWLFPSDKNE